MIILKNKKLIPFIISIVIFLIVTGLGCKEKNGGTPAAEAPTSPTPSPAPAPLPEETPAPDSTEADLRNLASQFAKVWGTYSSTDQCRNVRDLFAYMSAEFRKKMERFVILQCPSSSGSEAYSWETEVLDTVILEKMENYAEILVVCERAKKIDQFTKTYYSNLIISFSIEEGEAGAGEWRASDAHWAEQGL